MGAISVLDPHAARAVFDAACALAWADGDLAEPELVALRGLALALGLSDVVEETDAAIAQRTILPTSWRLARLDPRARVLCLAAAAWLAHADGLLHPREEDALADLGERCGLSAETARFALVHARWAASATDGMAAHRAATFLLVEGARRAGMIEAARVAA